MPFEILNNFLLVLGLSPSQFNEPWQERLNIFSLFLIFFNVIPQWNCVVWKIRNGAEFTDYVPNVLFATYSLISFLQFFFFSKNFKEIAELMKEISKFLTGDAKIQAEKDEKKFVIFFKFTLLLVIVSDLASALIETLMSPDHEFLTFNRYFFDTSHPIVRALVNFLGLYSLLMIDVGIFCGQISFFNICIHFVSVYQQLRLKIKKFDETKNESNRKNCIKDFVETHIEISKMVVKLNESFKTLWTFNYIMLVFSSSLTFLAFAKNGDLARLLINVPVVVIGLFVFCYPPDLVSHQV